MQDTHELVATNLGTPAATACLRKFKVGSIEPFNINSLEGSLPTMGDATWRMAPTPKMIEQLNLVSQLSKKRPTNPLRSR